MKKYIKLLVFLGITGLMLGFSPVSANEDEVKGGMPDKPFRPIFDGSLKDMRGEMKDDRKAFVAETKEEREAHRAKMEDMRKAFADKLKTDRDAWKLEVEKRKTEFKSATLERRKEFWGNVGEMLSRRFAMAVKMLEEAQIRVGKVIDKLHEDGKDTADATNYLNLSKEKLSDAKEKLEDIKNLLPDTGEKITPEIFEQIKLAAREAKDLLKESREDLKNAIKEIKSLRGEHDEEKDEDGDN